MGSGKEPAGSPAAMTIEGSSAGHRQARCRCGGLWYRGEKEREKDMGELGGMGALGVMGVLGALGGLGVMGS